MELRHLEYFVAVAEEGSVTGAAQRLRVAEPSLPHQVRALELELGGELLERLPRGVRLTHRPPARGSPRHHSSPPAASGRRLCATTSFRRPSVRWHRR